MIYGAMLAGGVGSRMKSAVIPKQFLEVEGKPIIIYTLQNMLKVDRFDYIYIATHKDYLAYMKEMVQKYTDKPEKVRIIEGGKERMDSIHNVTDAILKDEGVHEDDVIVIHDAVRPLVTEKILNDFANFVEEQDEFYFKDKVKIEKVYRAKNGDFKGFSTGGSVKGQSLGKSIIKRDFENFLLGTIESFKDIKPTTINKVSGANMA